ncbi:MAG: alpha-ketoglutarate-dependent dioxygenase AlkB, partial [Chitinophagales bacterium]
MKNSNFHTFRLPLKEDLFGELSNSVDFEDGNKGRKGNHLVKLSNEGIPIVRTTTKYNKPAHNFSPIHNSIVDSIKNAVNEINDVQITDLSFNNALIEIYDYRYFKMKYHSDQGLDLEEDSYIALFSCYERPADLSKKTLRKLRVKCKTSHKEFEIVLENNSVVLFSLETNTKFMHKIIL